MKSPRLMVQSLASAGVFFVLTGAFPAQQPTPQKIVGQPLGPIIGGVTNRLPNTPIPDPESAETVADWPTAMATGTVRDLKGDGVVGIPILLIQEETGQVRRIHTDSKGKYYFRDLPPGTYHLFIGEREDTRFFQKKLAGGMHWEADIPSRGQTDTTSPNSKIVPDGEPSDLPLTITHSGIAIILEAELPVITATDQETNNGRETIPLRVIEVIQGSFHSDYFDLTQDLRPQSGEALRPGRQYLLLLSIYNSKKKGEVYFPNGMIPREENPERFDRLVNWCRQFNSAAQAEHTPPTHLLELLISGIEDPAVAGMAAEILNECISDVERNQNDLSDELDLPDVAVGSSPPMKESMKRLIRWGSRRPSMFTDLQRDRIFSVLRQIPSSQSVPSGLRSLARSFSNKEYGQFLLGRVESVEGFPMADSLKDIRELANIIRSHDLNRLTFLLEEIRNRIDWNPKSEEAHSAKLALFRACRLIARDSMQQVKD